MELNRTYGNRTKLITNTSGKKPFLSRARVRLNIRHCLMIEGIKKCHFFLSDLKQRKMFLARNCIPKASRHELVSIISNYFTNNTTPHVWLVGCFLTAENSSRQFRWIFFALYSNGKKQNS